jgi:hypothetical protein
VEHGKEGENKGGGMEARERERVGGARSPGGSAMLSILVLWPSCSP